jgi:hypothetical protein
LLANAHGIILASAALLKKSGLSSASPFDRFSTKPLSMPLQVRWVWAVSLVSNPESRCKTEYAAQHLAFAPILSDHFQLVSERKVASVEQSVMELAKANDIPQVGPCSSVIAPPNDMARFQQRFIVHVT